MSASLMAQKLIKIVSASGCSLTIFLGIATLELNAQGIDSYIPDLAGIWDGTPRSRLSNAKPNSCSVARRRNPMEHEWRRHM